MPAISKKTRLHSPHSPRRAPGKKDTDKNKDGDVVSSETKVPSPKDLVKNGISLKLLRKVVVAALVEGFEGGTGTEDGVARFTLALRRAEREKLVEDGDGDGNGNGNGNTKLGRFTLEVKSYASMTREQRKEMLDLLEGNMMPLYTASKNGWSRSAKRREISIPQIRYLLVRPVATPLYSSQTPPSDSIPSNSPPASSPFSVTPKYKYKPSSPHPPLAGFIAFTPVLEPLSYTKKTSPVTPVTYCYEIQISSTHRSHGLGTFLLTLQHAISKQICVPENRLTVFRSNAPAIAFYARMGYRTACDDPEDEYVILSKVV